MFCPYKKQFQYVVKSKSQTARVRTIRNAAERVEYRGNKILVFDRKTNKKIGEY
jgi:hypothetical protein